MTDEEDNNGKQLCACVRVCGGWRWAGFRCDLALRCRDGVNTLIVLLSYRECPVGGSMDGNISVVLLHLCITIN